MENQNETRIEIKPPINETINADSLQLIKYCKEKQFTLAKEMLSTKFIDLELQDEAGCTGFHYACIYEDRALLDLLLDKYIFPHLLEEYIYHDTEHFLCLQEMNENKTILHYVSEKNLIEFYNKVELYFPQKIHNTVNYTTHSGHTALHLACEKGNSLILDKIIRITGLEVNKIDCHGNTALHLACQCSHIEIVKIL
ncbi:MAG: ankyrin repeat domain-containing protein [Burkholderiales bacterium]|nr:ankyrin repeat domain-containing protein [Burkholderiales bacterium]